MTVKPETNNEFFARFDREVRRELFTDALNALQKNAWRLARAWERLSPADEEIVQGLDWAMAFAADLEEVPYMISDLLEALTTKWKEGESK